MPDPIENRPGNGADEIQQVRATVQKKVQEANNDPQAEQKKIKLAGEILENFNKKDVEVEGTKQQAVRQVLAGKEIRGSKTVKNALVEVFEGVKQGVIKDLPPKSAALIQKLDKKIGDRLTDETASFIYPLVQKALAKELSATEIEQEFNNVKQSLLPFSPLMVKYLSDALIETAQEGKLGISGDEAKRKFEISDRIVKEEQNKLAEQTPETGIHRGESEMFGGYFESADDYKLLNAIYDPEKFVSYVVEEKNNLNRENPDWDKKKISQELTDIIQGDIAALFGKIYQTLDNDHPKEFFEEITKKDFFSGIERASIELGRRLNILRNHFSGEAGKKLIKDQLGDFEFTQYASLQPIEETVKIKYKDEQGKEQIAEKPRIRVQPLEQPRPIKFDEFLYLLHINTENYVTFRRYVHNARALFLHPPDKEGFYGKLGEYAESFSMVDLDSIMALPDADIFMRAFHLYDKYLEEMLASNDWKHHPTMFTRNSKSNFTDLELEILDKLKLIYKGTNVSDSRLRSALSMAVGASRGIFMNDPEKASFADPVTLEGKGNFASYYTEDNAPLSVFNPVLHFPYRFQTEGAMLHPLYFMSFLDAKCALGGTWDHKNVFNNMEAFRKSFVQGRHTVGKDKQLFIDWCTNIGAVGGPFQRMGWRSENWFATHYKYDNKDKNRLLVLKSWQEIEDIGYQALYDFVNWDRAGKPFLQEEKNRTDRMDFFKYLYKTYFGKDPSQLDSYLRGVRGEAEKTVYDEIGKGVRQPADIGQEIEYETSRIFLFRTLSRVVAQRIPSKFLRIDRDRFDQEGISRWNRIRKLMGITEHAEFDKVMKNFLLAEDALRQKVSKQMRDGLKARKGVSLNEIEGIEYFLTEDKIRNELLKEIITDVKDLNNVLEFYRLLQQEYSNNDTFLNSFATEIKDGKYKFTFAIDETDIGFVPFKSAGGRVLPRAIKDMAMTEQVLSGPVIQLPKLLHKVATDGKGDFSEIVAMIQKAKEQVSGIIGPDYAAEVAYRLSAMTISYFKKDTVAKLGFGIWGSGRINSIAAEFAERGTTVWEWDVREIDRFCIALETQNILKRKPYLFSTSKPVMVPKYVKIPFTNKFVKAGMQRQREIKWTSKDLRDNFGASAPHIAFEMINSVLPIVAIFFLWQLLQKTMEEFSGKKKQ